MSSSARDRMNQARPLLLKIDVKQCGNGIKRTGLFVCKCKGLLEATQLRPRHNKIYLGEKLKLACCLVTNSNPVNAKVANFMTT